MDIELFKEPPQITFIENSMYTKDNSKYIVRIPQAIIDGMLIKRPKKFITVFHGNQKSGKTTILEQISLYAQSQRYLVYYSNGESGQVRNFKVFNKIAMDYFTKQLEEIIKTKPEYQNYLNGLLSLGSFAKETDLVECLLGLAELIPICIIVDEWDLITKDSPLYNAHNRYCKWFLAGTGSWDPKSDQTRYPNNEYRHVNMISTVDVTKDFLDSVNKNPNLSTEVIMTLSNKCIGFACMILHCNTESEAESILNEFFKDKVSHLYMKLVKSRKFNAINTLKSAAIDNLKLLDHSWRLSGLVDMNCEFIHCILRKQLLQFNMCRDDLMECLQSYHFNREDVFESYMSFYFQKSNTLEIHCYQNIPAKPRSTKLFSITWTSFEQYYGQEVSTNVVYMLKPGFPTFDYFLINKNVLYGIQVSVTDTRELHDKSESISKRIEKVRDTLLEYVGNAMEIRYVYLSLTQQRIKSDKKNTYYVPCSAPGYLNFGDEDVYQLLLEKKNIK